MTLKIILKKFKGIFLTLSTIQKDTDLKLLNKISEQHDLDSIYPKTYHLSQQKFKEFVHKNSFSKTEIYLKE